MGVLVRSSSVIQLSGGLLMAVLLLIMTVAPTIPVIYGFFIVAPTIGLGALGAVLGMQGSAGRLGRVSGWAAAAGGIAVVVVGVFAIVTEQFSASAGLGDDDPLAIPFMVTSMSWMVGSLGVTVGMVRSRAIPARGAWLVLAGTISAITLGTILGMLVPQLSPLSALPFALGWMVVGWDGRQATRLAAA